MIIFRFRSKEDHEDLLKKVKKMEKTTKELVDVLEECIYEDDREDEWESEYRGGMSSMRRGGRYGYRGR